MANEPLEWLIALFIFIVVMFGLHLNCGTPEKMCFQERDTVACLNALKEPGK